MILLTIALSTSDIIGHQESEKRSEQPISQSWVTLSSALFAIPVLLKRRISRNCSQLSAHVFWLSALRTRTSRTLRKLSKLLKQLVSITSILLSLTPVSLSAPFPSSWLTPSTSPRASASTRCLRWCSIRR